MDTNKPVLKIILLGDSGVGKTSLMNQYVKKKFSLSYRRTIGADFYTKDVIVDNKVVTMQIWDTVGQERFGSLGVAFFRGADCVVLVYDVTSVVSYQSLKTWKEEFIIHGAPRDPKKFPFVVLGNKIDLRHGFLAEDKFQEVLACDYEVPYYQTSAKSNINVDGAFSMAAKMALEREKEDMYNPISEMMLHSQKSRNTNCSC